MSNVDIVGLLCSFARKGVSWFGFEGNNALVDGLWQRPIAGYLDFLAENGFNALRLPLAYNNVVENPVPAQGLLSAEPQLRGQNSMAILELLVHTELGQLQGAAAGSSSSTSTTTEMAVHRSSGTEDSLPKLS